MVQRPAQFDLACEPSGGRPVGGSPGSGIGMGWLMVPRDGRVQRFCSALRRWQYRGRSWQFVSMFPRFVVLSRRRWSWPLSDCSGTTASETWKRWVAALGRWSAMVGSCPDSPVGLQFVVLKRADVGSGRSGSGNSVFPTLGGVACRALKAARENGSARRNRARVVVSEVWLMSLSLSIGTR